MNDVVANYCDRKVTVNIVLKSSRLLSLQEIVVNLELTCSNEIIHEAVSRCRPGAETFEQTLKIDWLFVLCLATSFQSPLDFYATCFFKLYVLTQ